TAAGDRDRHRPGHRRERAAAGLGRDRRRVVHHAGPAQDLRCLLPGTEQAHVPAARLQEVRTPVLVQIEKPAPRVVRRPSALVLAAFVAGVLPFALHTWAALHGNFAQDDFVMTYRAAFAGPFDLGYLFQDYHGHLTPGGFFLAAVMTWWAP